MRTPQELERGLAAPETLGLETRVAIRQAAEQLLEAMPEGSGRLVIDLTHTRAVDSAGLGALMLIQRLAAERRQPVVLRNPSEEIRFLLTITKLYDLFTVEAELRLSERPVALRGASCYGRPLRNRLVYPAGPHHSAAPSGTGSRGTWHDAGKAPPARPDRRGRARAATQLPARVPATIRPGLRFHRRGGDGAARAAAARRGGAGHAASRTPTAWSCSGASA